MLDHWGLHQTIRQTFRLSVSVPRDHGYGLIHIRNTCKRPKWRDLRRQMSRPHVPAFQQYALPCLTVGPNFVRSIPQERFYRIFSQGLGAQLQTRIRTLTFGFNSPILRIATSIWSTKYSNKTRLPVAKELPRANCRIRLPSAHWRLGQRRET